MDAGGIDLDLTVEALLKQTDDNVAKGFRAIRRKWAARISHLTSRGCKRCVNTSVTAFL